MDRAVAYWVRIAERDIRSAAVLLEAGDSDNALFLCQQAVEKALKALIQTTMDDPPPKIHSLMRLAALAGVWDEMGDDQQRVLIALNPQVVLARYPLEVLGPDTHVPDVPPQRLLADAQEVVEWLLSRLKSS